MAADEDKRYFSYWGKARATNEKDARFHLLAFHSVDVAACGGALLALPQFSLASLAAELHWPLRTLERIVIVFLAMHDLGKFARSFQALAPDLSPALVPTNRAWPYDVRHDTLGWRIWSSVRYDLPVRNIPNAAHEFWACLIRAVVGHHGLPPVEALSLDGGDPSYPWFKPDDRAAAAEFIADLDAWLIHDDVPVPSKEDVATIRRHSWRLAGLAVLADWLGSDSRRFRYRETPCPLTVYWEEAQSVATLAVRSAGLAPQSIRHMADPLKLFDKIEVPSPLQRWASVVDIAPGPQLFLLEDVTGAGKTEAALILVQRLLQAGRANGLYFALPTMATANQMLRRVGRVYRRLYDPESSPSLVLAHGASRLVDDFQDIVLRGSAPPCDHGYGRDEWTATAQCSAWLADNRKKALLADVGVGTIDQALLGVLPVRHQSLRLAGLASKILVVDEVHAHDPYMHQLLRALLKFHARGGGSAVLLSATIPLRMRDELISSFQEGRGSATLSARSDLRYPLALQVHAEIQSVACDTRKALERSVDVAMAHDVGTVLTALLAAAEAGSCAGWICNTVGDARRAFEALCNELPAPYRGRLHLFHSRFAMGDRLAIEEEVLRTFGKASTSTLRAGHILVATQVAEQSLDLDFDVLVSDLAPIDRIIQRAGRLHRHLRDANGDPISTDADRRAKPTLILHCPPWDEQPAADWYSSKFPSASHVYDDPVLLWRTMRALREAGRIVTPGSPEVPGAVRKMVEAVYGDTEEAIPDAFLRATSRAEGASAGQRAQAIFNTLPFDDGYRRAERTYWDDRGSTPPRLIEETREYVLTEFVDGELQPLCAHPRFPWDLSTVRVAAANCPAIDPDWQSQHAGAIDRLEPVSEGWVDRDLILPLSRAADGSWFGFGFASRDRILRLTYARTSGLEIARGP